MRRYEIPPDATPEERERIEQASRRPKLELSGGEAESADYETNWNDLWTSPWAIGLSFQAPDPLARPTTLVNRS